MEDLLSEDRPPKDTQTEIYGRRIERIELAFQLKDTIDSLTLSNTDKMICKLLKDSAISLLISLGEVAASNCHITETKPICCLSTFQKFYQTLGGATSPPTAEIHICSS